MLREPTKTTPIRRPLRAVLLALVGQQSKGVAVRDADHAATKFAGSSRPSHDHQREQQEHDSEAGRTGVRQGHRQPIASRSRDVCPPCVAVLGKWRRARRNAADSAGWWSDHSGHSGHPQKTAGLRRSDTMREGRTTRTKPGPAARAVPTWSELMGGGRDTENGRNPPMSRPVRVVRPANPRRCWTGSRRSGPSCPGRVSCG